MLLVSPERLNNPGFRDEVLPRLAATAGLLVVDEAHCISDWGHDFRPDYRRIRTLLADLPDGIPVLATTATANARVTADVAEQLGTDVLVLRGSLDRESLRLGVVRLKTAEQRLAWLADHLAEQPGSGIVYCLTVAATQEVADYLRARGHDVAAYSGQTEATERPRARGGPRSPAGSRRWSRPARSAWASTPRLGFVVNLGRAAVAGRLLPAGRPRRPRHRRGARWCCCRPPRTATSGRYFASLAFPPRGAGPPDARRARRRRAGRCPPPRSRRYVDLRRTRLETMLKVLDVDGAVRRVSGGWDGDRRSRGPTTPSATTGSPRRASASRQAMLDYLDTDRLPDGVPARPARRPRGAPTAAAATTAAG